MAAFQHVLQSTIIIDEAEASIERAKVYSGDHGDAGVLAIFCDGSASPRPHNTQGDLYTSCAAVWKNTPADAEWQTHGKMLPLTITTSGGAEVCGLDLALQSGAAFTRNNPAAGIHTVKIFCDYQRILIDLRQLQQLQQLQQQQQEQAAGDESPASSSPLLQQQQQQLLQHKETVQSIVRRDGELARQLHVTVEIHWVKAHKGVDGNHAADGCAKAYRPDKVDPKRYPMLPGGKAPVARQPYARKWREEFSGRTRRNEEKKRKRALDGWRAREREQEEREHQERLWAYGHEPRQPDPVAQQQQDERTEEEKRLDREVEKLGRELGFVC